MSYQIPLHYGNVLDNFFEVGISLKTVHISSHHFMTEDIVSLGEHMKGKIKR